MTPDVHTGGERWILLRPYKSVEHKKVELIGGKPKVEKDGNFPVTARIAHITGRSVG